MRQSALCTASSATSLRLPSPSISLTSSTAAIDETAEMCASNDDAFNSEDDQSNYNFGIEYDLVAGDIVYIKITGYENFHWEMSYDFQIEKVG